MSKICNDCDCVWEPEFEADGNTVDAQTLLCPVCNGNDSDELPHAAGSYWTDIKMGGAR